MKYFKAYKTNPPLTRFLDMAVLECEIEGREYCWIGNYCQLIGAHSVAE